MPSTIPVHILQQWLNSLHEIEYVILDIPFPAKLFITTTNTTTNTFVLDFVQEYQKGKTRKVKPIWI